MQNLAHVCRCIYIYICMYVCMYVCMYIRVYVYIGRYLFIRLSKVISLLTTNPKPSSQVLSLEALVARPGSSRQAKPKTTLLGLIFGA